MKIKYKLLCIFLFVCFSGYAQNKKIIQDNNGKFIEAVFNNDGIIEKITGTVGNYYFDELNITIDNDVIKISKNSSADGCYDIEIINHDNYITLTKIFTANKRFKPRDNLTYQILFDENAEYLIKDDFIRINKSEKKSIGNDATDSYLPIIKYTSNTCIQYFGKEVNTTSIGSMKYEYTNDSNNIACYRIMPGDIWEKYLDISILDFISENTAINVINYLILYNYNYQLGVMLFPKLLNLENNSVSYIETEITADSYLTENSRKYLPELLNITEKDTPWVEGHKGDGIGSIICIKGKSEFKTLIISNGFDSEKKTLFMNNNRVKEIKVTDLHKNKNSFNVILPDSVEPFEIKLPFVTDNIKIEIISIYKGLKYDDTCINYILVKK